jgi:hypothetical protein
MRIENEQNAAATAKTEIMTYEGETQSNKLLNAQSEDEQSTSVCSCTCCLGGNSTNHDLLIDGYLPTDIVSTSSLKRASI